MKKTYINPLLNTYEIKAPNLLAVSGDDTKGSASIYSDGNSVSAGSALGREFDFTEE